MRQPSCLDHNTSTARDLGKPSPRPHRTCAPQLRPVPGVDEQIGASRCAGTTRPESSGPRLLASAWGATMPHDLPKTACAPRPAAASSQESVPAEAERVPDRVEVHPVRDAFGLARLRVLLPRPERQPGRLGHLDVIDGQVDVDWGARSRARVRGRSRRRAPPSPAPSSRTRVARRTVERPRPPRRR